LKGSRLVTDKRYETTLPASTQLFLAKPLEDLKDVLADPDFKQTFPDGLFTRKTLGAVPDRFSRGDPAAPYMKMVGLGWRKDLPDAALLNDEVMDVLIEIYRPASQLVRYFE
jgi:hypothetical protein